jgi:hypothetical protein
MDKRDEERRTERYMYVCMYVFVYEYMCVCVYIYICIYIYINIREMKRKELKGIYMYVCDDVDDVFLI